MTRAIAILVLALAGGVAQAAGGGGTLYHFDPDTGNENSVQRGARYFMNYCSGCHSLAYLRYGRLASDNGIPEDLLQQNLMFTSDKPGDHIISAMPADLSAEWFGRQPPDLTLTARARSPSWVYSFLMGFYLDQASASGVNNLQLPGASMPHVLGELQGYQVLDEHDADHGGGHGKAVPLKLAQPGTMAPAEYESLVADLTNFLTYAAEPGKRRMNAIGGWVLAYTALLILLTWLIKHEYWKDVH